MASTETLKTVIDTAKAVKEMVIEECAEVADAYAAEVQSGHYLSAAQEIAKRIRATKTQPE